MTREIRDLRNSKHFSMIAHDMLHGIEEITEEFLALVGGTDTSADVPIYFQEAWNQEYDA